LQRYWLRNGNVISPPDAPPRLLRALSVNLITVVAYTRTQIKTYNAEFIAACMFQCSMFRTSLFLERLIINCLRSWFCQKSVPVL